MIFKRFSIEDVNPHREGFTALESLMLRSLLWYYKDYMKRASEVSTYDELQALEAKAAGIGKGLYQCWKHANPGVYDSHLNPSKLGPLPEPSKCPEIPEPNPPKSFLQRIFYYRKTMR